MTGRSLLARAAIFTALTASGTQLVPACSSGEVTGGGLTEAGVLATTRPPEFDSGNPVDRLLSERACALPQWAGLYRDVFGPADKREGSCSFKPTCHGSPEGAGARTDTGIKCFDEHGCCESMFIEGLVKATNAANPDRSLLIRTLRRDGGVLPDGGDNTDGYMPKEPSGYVYPPETLERVREWIRLLENLVDAGTGPTDAGADAPKDGPSDAPADAKADREAG